MNDLRKRLMVSLVYPYSLFYSRWVDVNVLPVLQWLSDAYTP